MKYRKVKHGLPVLEYRDVFVDNESIWCGHSDQLNRKRRVVDDWKDIYRTSYRASGRYVPLSWWGNEDP